MTSPKVHPDEMFDDIPRAPWKVTQIDEHKNAAYIWEDREYPKGTCIAEVHAHYLGQLPKIANAVAALPELLEALRYASELIPIARNYFPKSVSNSDRFKLENTCATIGKALAKAEGR